MPSTSGINNFNLLNFIDTQSFNDSLVYYTQIIDRELNSRQQRNRVLTYDIIQQQTKIIPYCTIANPLNDVCPISQVQFELIDCVMQINSCKHNFNPYSLLRWFDSNSTCPMCRQNINMDLNDTDSESITNHIIRDREPYRVNQENENNHNDYNDESDYSSVG